MRSFFLLAGSLFVCVFAYAQEHCALQGNVFGSGRPVQGAGVFLAHDTVKEQVTITDSLGHFCFETVRPGTYRIWVRSLNYEPYESFIAITDKPVYTGIISLLRADSVLHEIVVAAAAMPVVQKNDTTEYAAGAYLLPGNASAGVLIRKLPGIMVSGGTITANGAAVMNILVDGKPFFAGDMATALAVLPAEMIAKVQVYPDRSLEEQAVGFGKRTTIQTINLVIKQNRKRSIFGNTYGGAGTKGRYVAGAGVNSFSGERRVSAVGSADNIHAAHYTTDQVPSMADNSELATKLASVNYTDRFGNMDIAAVYGYSKNTTVAETRSERRYTGVADTAMLYSGLDKNTTTTDAHNLGLVMDYRADSFNSLQVRPQISWQKSNTVADITGMMQQQGQVTGVAVTRNNAGSHSAAFSGDALYTHKWRRPGYRLVLGAGYRYKMNTADLTQSVWNGVPATDSQQQRTEMSATENDITVNAALGLPLGKYGRIQVCYDISSHYAASERNSNSFSDPGQSGVVVHTLSSNVFSSSVITQGAGITYGLEKRKTDLSLGILIQQAKQQLQEQQPGAFSASCTYRNILPQANLQYHFTAAKTIQLMYLPTTVLPDIMQLQPVPDNNNPMLLYAGNPLLKQVYQHNISLRYNAVNVARQSNYFLSVAGSYAFNYIGNSIFFAGADTLVSPGIFMRKGAQLSQPVNVNGYTYLNAASGFDFPLWRLRAGINIHGSMVQLPVVINGAEKSILRKDLGMDVSVNSNINSSIDISCTNTNAINTAGSTQTGQAVYYTSNTSLLLNLTLPAGILVNAGLFYRLNRGTGTGYNNDMLLCNLSVGKELWKGGAQLRAMVYDCTGQNKNISQFVTDAYTEQVWRNTIQQYVMLVLTCNFHRYRQVSL